MRLSIVIILCLAAKSILICLMIGWKSHLRAVCLAAAQFRNTMPFVLLHFHKETGPAGTLHRFSSGLLPQSGGAVLPPVSWENGRLPIFSADSSNRTVRDNSAVDPPETSVPRFFAGHISCGEGPDCHRSGQSPVPVSPPLLLGRDQRALPIMYASPSALVRLPRKKQTGWA